MSAAVLWLSSPPPDSDLMPSVRPRHNRLFAFAILLSALAHLVALGWLPGLERVTVRAPLPLRILLQPTPVALPPPAAVEPPAVAPAPSARHMAARSLTKTPDRSEVITAPVSAVDEAQTRMPPVAVVPVVAPVVATAPVQAPVPAPAALDPRELAGYGRSVATVVAQHQRYPRIAQLRQWQGTTMLQLEFSAEGRLLETRVLSSSGHEVLDRQALDMVRAAQPLPPLPSVLAGRALVVTVPVVFRLAG